MMPLVAVNLANTMGKREGVVTDFPEKPVTCIVGAVIAEPCKITTGLDVVVIVVVETEVSAMAGKNDVIAARAANTGPNVFLAFILFCPPEVTSSSTESVADWFHF